jgi:hypothetical protein
LNDLEGEAVANLMFYAKPVLLDKNAHKNLCVTQSESDFAFAAKISAVIIAMVEFVPAAWDYPIVFARDPDGKIVPVALLGIRRDENLFVTDGKWRYGSYVPAFIRRYPFIPAETGSDQLAICIDETYAGFAAGSGAPLFDEKGEPAALLKQAIALMRDYYAQCMRTADFTRLLGDLELFKELSIRIEMKDGTSFVLSEVLAVDEAKFTKLTKEAVCQLHDAGYLTPVYAHLFSQAKLARLVDLLAERSSVEGDSEAARSAEGVERVVPAHRSIQ